MLKPVIIFALVFWVAMPLMAQQERKFIREGNELFEKQDFEKAEVEYRKAADKKMDSFEAGFPIWLMPCINRKNTMRLYSSLPIWQRARRTKNV